MVPAHPNRKEPWPLDKHRYKHGNEVGRLFVRIKAWRRIFTRCDKTDIMFAAFLTFILIDKALRLR